MAELRDSFAQPKFQSDLVELWKLYEDSPVKFSLLRAEAIFAAQAPILAKYGFEPTRLGVHSMLLWFEALQGLREFAQVSDECNLLLGIEGLTMLTTPEELEATAARVEEVKERFRN